MPTFPAHRFTVNQTTLAVTPVPCMIPPFRIRLKTLPSLTPECRSQVSTSSLHHDGIGTVRIRPPLPTRLAMIQRPPVCSWSKFSPTTSERRNPHPNSNPRIAPSLWPRRVFFDAELTKSWACFPLSQLPTFRPSRLTPLTRLIPIASSGLSQPLSADSSASRRIAERCRLIVAAERERCSRHER